MFHQVTLESTCHEHGYVRGLILSIAYAYLLQGKRCCWLNDIVIILTIHAISLRKINDLDIYMQTSSRRRILFCHVTWPWPKLYKLCTLYLVLVWRHLELTSLGIGKSDWSRAVLRWICISRKNPGARFNIRYGILSYEIGQAPRK